MENTEPMMICSYIIVVIFFIFIGIPMLVKSYKITKKTFGEDEFGEKEVISAKIVYKKTYTPVGAMAKFNFIIFEKRTGERIELAIKDDEQYKMMMEGDEGILTHIGKRFVSFVR